MIVTENAVLNVEVPVDKIGAPGAVMSWMYVPVTAVDALPAKSQAMMDRYVVALVLLIAMVPPLAIGVPDEQRGDIGAEPVWVT